MSSLSARRPLSRPWLKSVGAVFLAVTGLITLRLLGPDVIDQQQLRQWIEPFGKLAPLAFIAFLAIRPLLLLPRQLCTAVGGLIFGAFSSTFYSLLGNTLALLLIILLARKLGTRVVKRLSKERFPAIIHAARRHDFSFAFLSFINPLFPTDIMMATTTAVGARMIPTLSGAVLGMLPGTLLATEFGSALSQRQDGLVFASGLGMLLSLIAGAFLGRKVMREISEFDAKHHAASCSKDANADCKSFVSRSTASGSTIFEPSRTI